MYSRFTCVLKCSHIRQVNFSLTLVQRSRRRTPFLCRHLASHRTSDNPYRILGISPNSSYDSVKRAFVNLALECHPDREGGSTEMFVRIRDAFEAIQAGMESSEQSSPGWTQEELRNWFREETGEFLTFKMNESTRQEVIRAYKELKPSGRDKGGYWDMARVLTEREHMRGEDDDYDGPMKQLTGSSAINRRRRRR